MIPSMLIVNYVLLTITKNVLNVTPKIVKFVMSTELLLTVNVKPDMLKFQVNVFLVLITVLLVLVPQKTVLPVLVKESIQTNVSVHMENMTT